MQIQIYKNRTHKSTYILQCISTSTATRLVNIMNFVPVWIEKCAFAELTVLEYTVQYALVELTSIHLRLALQSRWTDLHVQVSWFTGASLNFVTIGSAVSVLLTLTFIH